MNNRYGFIEPKKIEKEEHIFGDCNFKGEILNENGQWDDSLPVFEKQRNVFFDTMHCPVFGTLNAIEILERFKYLEEKNWSERYGGVIGGVTPSGGSPHVVAEAMRKHGCIPQKELDFTPDMRNFYQFSKPRPMTQKYLDMGDKWLKNYDFSHDWLFTYTKSWWDGILKWIVKPKDRTELLKEALKYSPVCVSVLAYKYRKGKIYKLNGERDNHWVVCYGFVEGDHWKLYDHYDKKFVEAEWNYPFNFAKRYSLNRINLEEISIEDVSKKYEYRAVKGHIKNSVYLFAGFRKHVYPDWITFIANGKKAEDIITLPQNVVDKIPDGNVLDIRNTKVWPVIKELKYPDNMKKVVQYIEEYGSIEFIT